MPRINCFISFHNKDKKYVEELREKYKRIRNVSDWSVKKGITYKSEKQIYNYIKYKMNNCAVTIVLIGKHTGKRKWVDWEIWGSLQPFRDKKLKYNPGFRPSGILAIYLPKIKKHSVPKRLQDNIDSGYVVSMDWKSISNNKEFARKLVLANRTRNKTALINNTRPRKQHNTFSLF